MINFYLLAIKKSFKLIKQEPTILAPILVFQIIINCLIYLGVDLEQLIATNFSLILVIEWLIPTVIIEPIIIFWAWINIKKIKMDINQFTNQYLYGLGGIFLISMLGKPLDIYLASKITPRQVDQAVNTATSTTVFSEVSALIIILWVISIIFRLFTIYFKFDYLTSLNKSPNIYQSLKNSVVIFLKYKWVTICSILYLSMVLLLALLSISAVVAIFIPQQYHQIAFSLLLGTLPVFSTLFFLVIFMKLKPITSLNDS